MRKRSTERRSGGEESFFRRKYVNIAAIFPLREEEGHEARTAECDSSFARPRFLADADVRCSHPHAHLRHAKRHSSFVASKSREGPHQEVLRFLSVTNLQQPQTAATDFFFSRPHPPRSRPGQYQPAGKLFTPTQPSYRFLSLALPHNLDTRTRDTFIRAHLSHHFGCLFWRED